MRKEDIGPVTVFASAMEAMVFVATFILSLASAFLLIFTLFNILGWSALTPLLWIDSIRASWAGGPCCPEILVDAKRVLGNGARNLVTLAFLLLFAATFGIVNRFRASAIGPIKALICFAYAFCFILIFGWLWARGSDDAGAGSVAGWAVISLMYPLGSILLQATNAEWFRLAMDGELLLPGGGVNPLFVTGVLFSWQILCIVLMLSARLAASAFSLAMGYAASPLYRRHVHYGAKKFRLPLRQAVLPPSRRWIFIATPFLRQSAMAYALFLTVCATFYFLWDPIFQAISILARDPDFFTRYTGMPNPIVFFLFVFGPVVGVLGYLAFARGRRADNRLATELLILSLLFPVWLYALGGRNYFVFLMLFPLALMVLASRRWFWLGLKESCDRFLAARQRDNEYEQFLARRPILYLRAFMDDRKTLSARFSLIDLLMGVRSVGQRFEEVVAERAFNWRPVVALGNPHLDFQLHGVWKRDIPNTAGDAWKHEVERLVETCPYTVMIANTTDNIGWEIEHLRTTGRIERIIFVITDAAVGQTFFRQFAIPEAGVSIERGSLVVYHDFEYGWTMLTSSLRTYSAYAIAIDIAVARLEQGVERAAVDSVRPSPFG